MWLQALVLLYRLDVGSYRVLHTHCMVGASLHDIIYTSALPGTQVSYPVRVYYRLRHICHRLWVWPYRLLHIHYRVGASL